MDWWYVLTLICKCQSYTHETRIPLEPNSCTCIPSNYQQEEKTINENKNRKEEVIRFKTTTEQKTKIERAAQKRGITVSEYLRQSVSTRMSRERPTDWYPTVARLEEICSEADGQVREDLVELIRSLYQGGA